MVIPSACSAFSFLESSEHFPICALMLEWVNAASSGSSSRDSYSTDIQSATRPRFPARSESMHGDVDFDSNKASYIAIGSLLHVHRNKTNNVYPHWLMRQMPASECSVISDIQPRWLDCIVLFCIPHTATIRIFNESRYQNDRLLIYTSPFNTVAWQVSVTSCSRWRGR